MTTISDADMQAAREFCIKSGHPYGPDFKLVAEAVAAERERCATVALEQRCERRTGWDLACVAIADAIRKQR